MEGVPPVLQRVSHLLPGGIPSIRLGHGLPRAMPRGLLKADAPLRTAKGFIAPPDSQLGAHGLAVMTLILNIVKELPQKVGSGMGSAGFEPAIFAV